MSAERLRRLDDDALAAAIRTAGGSLRWPATLDVEATVRRGIAAAPPRSGAGPVWATLPRRRRLVLVIAAALVLLGGAALATKLVIDIGAVMITTTPERPTVTPTEPVAGADLGTPVSLGEATRLTGVTPRYPTALGEPDEVWVDEGVVGFEPGDETRWIAMSWTADEDLPPIGDTGRGAVLIQFHGEAQVAMKLLYEEVGSMRVVGLDGAEGFWITGRHTFRLPVDGELRSLRVDGNVLVWQEGADTFRLEVGLPLRQAVALAGAVSD